jgi:hypothetical protein
LAANWWPLGESRSKQPDFGSELIVWIHRENRGKLVKLIKSGSIGVAQAFLAALLFAPTIAAAESDVKVNSLQSLMFYRSFVQDNSNCSLAVFEGKVVFSGAGVSSAAANCPDAFAWSQFAESISQEWWNWGIDQTVWPAQPLPLCTADSAQTNCCNPNAPIVAAGSAPTQCPVFRADYETPSPLPAQPTHGTPSSSVINHRGLQTGTINSPARLLRDLELEIVFRNKAMVDYIYRNDLYSREGMGARNQAQNTAMGKGDIAKAHSLEVRFPIDAIMAKADFLHQQILLDQGLIQTHDNAGNALNPPNNPDYPYITVRVGGNPANGDVPGLYYLLAMTNASKDLPIWHWYAIEHVANPARCDYIGCNDSFGYVADGTVQAGADFGTHYIPPHMVLNDDRSSDNDPLFDPGKVYLPAETGEEITSGLKALFAGLSIGTADKDLDPDSISVTDPAWYNYRLKGTQSAFTTSGGVPTGTGASITEGGFVNSASCASCHSQASVNANGSAGMQGVGGTWRPNLEGYGQVEMGSPDANWFYSNTSPPTITATQIDFVWGILNASCQVPGKTPSSPCVSYPDQPTIIAPQQ